MPVQVANLSLQEITLKKSTNIGVASPIQIGISEGDEKCHVSLIEQSGNKSVKDFESYLQKKLAHLDKRDQVILKPVLRQYKQLFYGLGGRGVRMY